MQFAKRCRRRRSSGEAGTWLKKFRARAGLSQIELTERLGLKYYTFISQVDTSLGCGDGEIAGARPAARPGG